MRGKWSVEYIDRLLTGYDLNLSDLSCVMLSDSGYDHRHVTLGLPEYAFVFTEVLVWEAQSVRSGVWTYYEATSTERQAALIHSLAAIAPEELVYWYRHGTSIWRDETKICEVDDWITKNESQIERWLLELARQNREALIAIT